MKALYVGSPVGWGMMRPEMALYFCQVTQQDAPAAGFDFCQIGTCCVGRIHQARNIMVQDARSLGSTHIMMVDPDMLPDVLFNSNGKRFVVEAAKFLEEHPLAIAGAPACGSWPKRRLNVFVRDPVEELRAMTHDEAAKMSSWHEVFAVGTGQIMFRVDMLDHFDKWYGSTQHPVPPYFKDTFTDEKQTKLFHTQDVQFCRQCGVACVPTYVNFDCWCGHYKTSCIMPDFVADKAGLDTAVE